MYGKREWVPLEWKRHGIIAEVRNLKFHETPIKLATTVCHFLRDLDLANVYNIWLVQLVFIHVELVRVRHNPQTHCPSLGWVRTAQGLW